MTEKATTIVDVNGKSAQDMLTKLEASAKKYRDAMKEATKAGDLNAWKKNNDALKKVNKDMNTFKKSSFDTAKVLKNLNGTSLSDLQRAKKALVKETQTLNRNTAEYANKSKDLQKVTAEISKVKGEMFGASKNTGFLSNALGSIKNMLPAIGFGTLIMGAKKLAEFTTELKGFRSEVKKLTGETGTALDSNTARIIAIADTYNKDFNQVLEASNNLSKQMGISFTEAFDLIEQGFQAGADVNGEFLDNLREYPAYFKEAGYNAEQFMVAITKQTKDGIFSDKGVDAIKEANIRLREMTPSTQEALQAIGISSKEMSDQLASGEIKMSDAISMVSKKLAEMPPQSQEVGQALADIFGGPGEDAGVQFITTLSEVNGQLSDMVDNTDDVTRAQQNQLVASKELNEAYLKMLGQGSALSVLWSNIKKQAGTELNDLATVISTDDMTLFQKLAVLGNKTKREQIATGLQAVEAAEAEEESQRKLHEQLIKTAEGIGVEIDMKDLSNEQIQELIDKRQLYLNSLRDEEAELQKLKETQEKLQAIQDKYFQNNALKAKADQRKLAQELSDIKFDDLFIEMEQEFAETEKFEQAKLQLRRQYGLVTIEEDKRKELDLVRQGYADGLLSYEEYEAAKADIANYYRQLKIEQDLVDEEEETVKKEAELEQLEMDRENGLLNEEQYQAAKNEIIKKYADEEKKIQAEKYAELVQTARQYAGAVSGVLGALSGYYESQKQRELKAAGDNEQKKEQITRKYAKKQQRIQLIQAIINTALGITSALTAEPPASFIMAALAAIMGGIQIATISQQQFAKGRYPVRGADDGRLYNATVSAGTTGIYSEPTITPGFGLYGETADPEMVIDGKTFRNIQLNTPELIPAIMSHRVPQYAAGDYSSANTGFDMNRTNELLEQNIAINQRLNYNLENPKPAIAVYDQDETMKIRDNLKQMDQIEHEATRP